jgi:energy-coupling factor transport system permease protein
MYHTGVFIKGESLIYNLDPRVKLAFIFFLSIIILWAKPPAVLLIGITLFFTALANGISFRTIGQAVKPLLFFTGLIFAAHALFSEGKAFVTIPYLGISFSLSGVQEGFIVTWRFLCLIVAAVLLTMTTAPSSIIAAIKFFLRPLKFLRVPVDDIAVMIMLALRLMPVLIAEKEKIETAQKARGYDLFRSGFIIRIKAFLSLTLSVLLGVFRRADELALAMEARGYAGGERTSMTEMKLTSSDYLMLAVTGIFIIIFIALYYCFS